MRGFVGKLGIGYLEGWVKDHRHCDSERVCCEEQVIDVRRRAKFNELQQPAA
jgi:hypothetical protein